MTSEIHLCDGRTALVDEEHWIRLMSTKWHLSSHGYVMTGNTQGKRMYMHRIVLKLVGADGLVVDHINRNKLDNRVENLRLVSIAENVANQGKNKRNKSGLKGVWFDTKIKRWRTCGNHQRKTVYLGTFDTKELAYERYKQWCAENGRFAS